MEAVVDEREESNEVQRLLFGAGKEIGADRIAGEPVSRADPLLTLFNQTRQSKEQAAALDQIIKFHHEFKDPKTQLQPIVEKIEIPRRKIKNCIPRSPSSLSWREMICSRTFRN